MFVTEPHPSFSKYPGPDDLVWRYMDVSRYLSLLQSSSLHFASADLMSDRWEGSFSSVNQAVRPKIYGESYDLMWANADGRRSAVRRMMRMSCWHANEFESAAMWEIYQREGRGVAIQSAWADLTQSITSDRPIFGGNVTYADYSKTFIPEGNAFDAFMHKRASYSHEREVRLMTMSGETPDPPVVSISVELPRLVKAVFVAPDAPEWIPGVIESVTRAYMFDFEIRQSDLSQDPIA